MQNLIHSNGLHLHLHPNHQPFQEQPRANAINKHHLEVIQAFSAQLQSHSKSMSTGPHSARSSFETKYSSDRRFTIWESVHLPKIMQLIACPKSLLASCRVGLRADHRLTYAAAAGCCHLKQTMNWSYRKRMFSNHPNMSGLSRSQRVCPVTHTSVSVSIISTSTAKIHRNRLVSRKGQGSSHQLQVLRFAVLGDICISHTWDND